MRMRTGLHRLSRLLPFGMLLSGCVVGLSNQSAERPPLAFHDTRLQFALLTDDRQMLREDFQMAGEPTMTERVVSGCVLPFTASTELLFWPVSTSIKAYLGANVSGVGKQVPSDSRGGAF